MSMLRRRVAERLVHAQHTAAILTTFNEIDMTNIMALRTKYKDQFKEKHGIGLGFIAYTAIKLLSGRLRDLHPLMIGISAAFLLGLILPYVVK